jgi:hypothetical protein
VILKGCAGERAGTLILLLREKRVRLGLVVEGEGQAPGTYVVEFSLGLHIPNSTGNFKLDRQETGPTEVCMSSLDLANSNLF